MPLVEEGVTQTKTVKRAIVEGHSKKTRRERRRDLSHAQNLMSKPSTKQRYNAAAKRCFQYLVQVREAILRSPDHMDQILSQYIEELWADGES
jgi:site-specific recombinase XerD